MTLLDVRREHRFVSVLTGSFLTSTSSRGHSLHDEFDNQVEKLNYKERGREGRRERRRKRELENTDVPTLKYMNS